MNALALALTALRGISTLLGGVTIRGRDGSELLNLLASLVEEGADAFEDLKAFTGTIETMVADNRDPTSAEWDDMRSRGQAAHDRLQAVKEELTAEEETVEEETPEAEPVPEAEPEAEEEADPTPTPEGQP
ncbi:hypothetical protein LCGC14_0367100 [marine sediment metagenome]|uniref:Uncharacterized protein n=1 Tax=marine sediment metagenome TaxID=412755 RepID=A0A0F9TC48_9ZZZZ